MCRQDLGSTTPGRVPFSPHFCRKLRTVSPLQSGLAGHAGHFTASKRQLKNNTDLFHPGRKTQAGVGAVVIQNPLSQPKPRLSLRAEQNPLKQQLLTFGVMKIWLH